MTFHYSGHRSLPPHAWLADIGTNDIHVSHGIHVETRADGFFEGAWTGSFEAFEPLASDFVAGSGAVATARGLILIPPSHTLEAIYAAPTPGRAGVVASNSLPFLLEAIEDELRPDFREYQELLAAVFRRGVCSGPRVELPTAKGSRVQVYYHSAIQCEGGRIIGSSFEPKPRAFVSFEEYASFLTSTLESLFANARDTRRTAVFRPLACISNGYDSPACAALAARAGCREGITFIRAREEFEDRHDDGSAIGATLGIRTHRLDAFDNHDVHTEFIAANGCGGDHVFACAESLVKGTLLVTGFNGDQLWSRNPQHVTRNLIRHDRSGMSLTEFRLRVGFIHVPLPFAGGTAFPEIAAMSQCLEMLPWSVGGDYDRPIPRRIVEEAGVPRGKFAVSKKAINLDIGFSKGGPAVPPRFRTELEEYARRELGDRWFAQPVFFNGLGVLSKLELGLRYRLKRILPEIKASDGLLARFTQPLEAGLLFQFAVSRLKQRYELPG